MLIQTQVLQSLLRYILSEFVIEINVDSVSAVEEPNEELSESVAEVFVEKVLVEKVFF